MVSFDGGRGGGGRRRGCEDAPGASKTMQHTQKHTERETRGMLEAELKSAQDTPHIAAVRTVRAGKKDEEGTTILSDDLGGRRRL